MRLEEGNFKQTLDRGYEELRQLSGNFGETYGPGLDETQKVLAGSNAFALYDSRGFPLDTLSMGMSDDLEAAIAEGATMVRVGRAIFGERR